jgi:hypothetical protein
MVSETSLAVPIFVVGMEGKVNLYRSFLGRNVLTTSGSGFPGLGVSFVRIRTPREGEPLLRVIREVVA